MSLFARKEEREAKGREDVAKRANGTEIDTKRTRVSFSLFLWRMGGHEGVFDGAKKMYLGVVFTLSTTLFFQRAQSKISTSKSKLLKGEAQTRTSGKEGTEEDQQTYETSVSERDAEFNVGVDAIG